MSSSNSARTDFFKYFDPSPILEHDTLNRVQKQIDLIPAVQKIAANITRISSHLGAIEDDIHQLISSFECIGLSPGFKKIYTSLASMFSYFGTSLIDQCNLNLNVFTVVLLPGLINQRNEFNRTNAEYQRIIEEYGNLSPKSKPDILATQEQQLQNSMQARADTFFILTELLETAEKASIPAATIALSSFLSSVGRSMKECADEIIPNVGKLSESVAPWQLAVKDALKMIPPQNQAGQYAKRCWELRQKAIKPTPELIHASGIMWLRSHRLVTTWSRKYVIFEDDCLHFYDPQTATKDNTIPLSLVTVTHHESSKRRFCFKIQSPQSLIRLQALSNFDEEEWTTILTEHNSKILRGPDAEGPSAKQICADCGAKDATWCSLNWCSYICLKCSGVHRQMSTSTSKVRSTVLDKLGPYIQEMLILMTNNAANNLLLAKPVDMEIDPRMDDQLRQIFITRKYQRMDWKTSEPIPDPFSSIANLDYFALFHSMNFGKSEETFESITPLHAAAACGDTMIATIATCCSQTIDVEDENGWTPLSYAVYFDNVDVVRILVDFGAQPSKANMDLFTLTVAVGNEEIMNLILKTAKYSPGTKVFKPKTMRFAPEKKANLIEIQVTQDTKELANLLFRAENPAQ